MTIIFRKWTLHPLFYISQLIFQHIFTRTVVQTRFVPRQFKLFFSSTFERFPEYIYIGAFDCDTVFP